MKHPALPPARTVRAASFAARAVARLTAVALAGFTAVTGLTAITATAALTPALTAALGLTALATLPGCAADPDAEATDAAPKTPDDPAHLQERFERLVAAARAGERDAVLGLIEPLLLTRDDLVTLFGPTAGEAAWPGYSDQIAGRLRVEAADVIIERVRDGFDTVDVERVGPAYPDRTTPGDQRMLEALVPRGLAMYTVRLREPNGKLGLRFNGFIFHGGRWRALLKAYDFLPREPEPEATPAADAPPDGIAPEGTAAPDGIAPNDNAAPDGIAPAGNAAPDGIAPDDNAAPNDNAAPPANPAPDGIAPTGIAPNGNAAPPANPAP